MGVGRRYARLFSTSGMQLLVADAAFLVESLLVELQLRLALAAGILEVPFALLLGFGSLESQSAIVVEWRTQMARL